ncbi:LOW QUALITY PROTEIN: ornithine decarboxylase antizyme [Drosophila persimilis]|uniref:Ornithine decarboxylase antizyme n=1 Tax=Drosophila pseudoobscura pseudoobscura TaxID=46245 RepID=A0A6I8V3Q3_DROPS|nr:LOW QUALITY PROTEIN: ornithine decarboxylase antizyme [Drosophila pseudoobscura]XP_026842781.1 LOW QUALITY PROTEIN: ornithine decarboxylase antizyme [Drosophila persimilis]
MTSTNMQPERLTQCDPMFSSIVRRDFNDSGIADGKFRTISTSSCATNMSNESYRISLGVGPLWWSDVPVHHRTDHDRASLLTGYSRKSSVDSAGGSLYEVSSRSSSPSSSSECSDSESHNDIHSLCSDDDCQEVLRQILQHDQPVQISIKLHVTEDQYTNWMSILNPVNNMLYVAFPKDLPPAGSKETFLSLLEFAEDKLEVDGIVMAMRKDHPERTRLIEAFLFMGFEPMSRKAPQAPPSAINDKDNYYFLYTIEG